MMKAIWEAAKGLMGSKKFQAAAISAVVWGVGKLGLHLSAEEVGPLVAPFWVYIAGQAVADHGKSAAEVNADAKA